MSNLGRAILKTELYYIARGIFMGLGSRLLLAGATPNSEILPSLYGLAAMVIIAYGLGGLLFGIQHRLLVVFPCTTALVFGIMWVIPLPFTH